MQFSQFISFSSRKLLSTLNTSNGSRDSSVGIALGYGMDDRGSRFRFPAGTGNFSLHHRVQNGSGAYPASYPMGTRGSFPGGKAAGAWSWPLVPRSKNEWNYTSTPEYAFMTWCLVKAQGQFYLYLYWPHLITRLYSCRFSKQKLLYFIFYHLANTSNCMCILRYFDSLIYLQCKTRGWTTTTCQLSAAVYSVFEVPSMSGDRLLHPQPENAPCRGERNQAYPKYMTYFS
jgi:hypothetical protein